MAAEPHPVTQTENKLVHTSEVILIALAACLLAMANPQQTPIDTMVTVDPIQPASDLNTVVSNHPADDATALTTTTAFLTLEEEPVAK